MDLTKQECYRREDHVYHSFDISGHSFLLTFNVLVLMEESKEILHYLYLARSFGGNKEHRTEKGMLTKLDERETQSLRSRFSKMSPLIILGIGLMWLVCLLWDFMLIITTIYYHTFQEKLIGTVLAFIMWYVLYKKVFFYTFRLEYFIS